MGIKVNLTQDEIKGAQSSAPAPLPEGIYGAQIYNAVYKLSKSSNKPMYEIEFKITDGPAGIGRKRLLYWASLAPNALFSTIKVLKALGLPYPNKETPAGEFEFPDAEEFVGEQVNIKLIVEPYASVNDEDEEITAYRNVVKDVRKYDVDKVTDAEDVDDAASAGGVFL